MENELILRVKEILYSSPIKDIVGEEKIESALSNIHICETNDKLRELYMEKTGFEYDGYLEGFNNSGISYFTKESDIHPIIHEILHTLSSTFDEKRS